MWTESGRSAADHAVGSEASVSVAHYCSSDPWTDHLGTASMVAVCSQVVHCSVSHQVAPAVSGSRLKRGRRFPISLEALDNSLFG